MFERYTENARRAIFFARYEASVYTSNCIESEHLLLGVLREYPSLSRGLPVEKIREQIERKFPKKQSISTSVDLPLSPEAHRALGKGAEAADRLRHRHIQCGHLVLGLMQESAVVAEIFKDNGIGAATIEGAIREPEHEPHPGASVSFDIDPFGNAREIVRRLAELFRASEAPLFRFVESEAEMLVGQRRWSRKQALGHLIDSAATHLNWIARALTEPKPTFSGPPQPEWATALGYKTFPWRDMVPLWVSLNLLLAHAIAGIPEEKFGTICRIGIEPAAPLSALIQNYVVHCEEVMTEILSVGHPPKN